MSPLTYAILKDKEVIPVSDVETWAKFFENNQNRIVIQESFGESDISTVFLGINHGSPLHPLWFETMVFGGEHDMYQERYGTWPEAVAGHNRAIEMVRRSRAN